MKNKPLYNAIKTVFKETPKIINEDEPAIFLPPPPTVSFSSQATLLRPREIAGGEQYVINCPFCNDTRNRLYFSHMWDTVIKFNNVYYRAPTSLFHCFNEECQREKEFKTKVVFDLRRELRNPSQYEMAPEEASPRGEQEVVSNVIPMPEHIIPLDSPNVPGYILKYIANRSFTVKQLMEFGVLVAKYDKFKYPFLLAPVNQYGNYWFWQGRMVPLNGELDGPLELNQYGEEVKKYYIVSGAKKSWVLYNADNAVKYNKIVVVEGITDVWRCGLCAVAKFGRSLSQVQRKMLTTRFSGRDIVLVPDMNDPLAYDEGVEDMLALRVSDRFRSVTIAKLPAGKDPGSVTEQELWHCINLSTNSPV